MAIFFTGLPDFEFLFEAGAAGAVAGFDGGELVFEKYAFVGAFFDGVFGGWAVAATIDFGGFASVDGATFGGLVWLVVLIGESVKFLVHGLIIALIWVEGGFAVVQYVVLSSFAKFFFEINIDNFVLGAWG